MINRSKAAEIAEYLLVPKKTIIEKYSQLKNYPHYIKWVKVTNEEWHKQVVNNSSKTDVEKWFKQTEQYIFELMEVHSAPKRQKLNKKIISFLKKRKVGSVLDFGAGIGENTIQMAQTGFKVTHADLPGKTLDFAKWRINRKKLSVEIIVIKNDKPLEGKYFDAIICIEVFQHLFKPLITAGHLYKHLNKGGYLLFTTRFNNPGYAPALTKNIKYESTFPKKLESLGFKFLEKNYQWGEKEKAKYLYIYQK